MQENIWDDENLINILKNGGLAVMPTDSIYGIVGQAGNEATVERIYKTRKRNPDKPCIILVGDIGELEKFAVSITKEQKDKIQEFWPLLAPSANLEGLPPSETVQDAEKYFGNEVDIYIDGGTIKNKASRLIKLHKDGSVDILRE